MKKAITSLLLSFLATTVMFAQHAKHQPSPNVNPTAPPAHIVWPGKAAAPLAENPFNVAVPRPKPQTALQTSALDKKSNVSVTRAENGMPILYQGKTEASGTAAENKPMSERALEYCASLNPEGISDAKQEFQAAKVQTDEQGNAHVRLEQSYQGLPVWGGEVICHTRNGAFDRMNGRYFPTPVLASTTPALGSEAAINTVKARIGAANIKAEWTPEELRMIDGQPFSAELLVYHVGQSLNGERLAWHVAARPNILSRSEWFVDAISGEVLDHFEHTCNLLGHINGNTGAGARVAVPAGLGADHSTESCVNGPVTISGTDLLNVNRTFTNGGWQSGSQYFLEDASKAMFNSGASNMPTDPVGVLVTADAGNTSPENSNFNADLVFSNTSTISNKTAVSAQYNAEKSFDYYQSKYARNSIDGVGGNVISFINVTESDGSSMENAFWNGQAMFYGNGGTTFKPLARGLDVGGHEMTHGVIEKTANLIYQDESGALNESFADIFGQMIDGDANDWKIGEDVMQSGGGLPAALRDLSNPHNGQAQNSGFWQPNHTSEQLFGSDDNGFVHVNSGITNHAYYLFASNASVGTAKAEKVYYKALTDYLVKSSKFIDCRVAVIQAATDLFGASVANIAADAFTQVGIGSGGGTGGGGNYLGQLNPNPGQDLILCTSDDGKNLDVAVGTGQVLGSLYTDGILSRPSVTDNGASAVFINNDGHLIGIDFTYNTQIQYTITDLDAGPWRNAAISKDGRFIALLKDYEEPRIYIYDLADPNLAYETFYLYNPTYTQGQITGDVKYADVMEFDYSGQYLMYDSNNDLDGQQYWDIGFVQFWENGQFTDGGNAFITKLFTGLPEKVSIGNPTIAKNSPFIIAFDLIDETSGTPEYDILGANSETGDYDAIVANNFNLGWPNYNRLDNKIIFEKADAAGYDLYLQGIDNTKIKPQGNSANFIASHYWGVWYANGSRSLQVGTHDLADQSFQVSVSPNPTADVAQLSLRSETATDAVINLYSVLGQLVMTRSLHLQAGQNRMDMDLQTLPAGNYVLRIAAENGMGAAVKVVKN